MNSSRFHGQKTDQIIFLFIVLSLFVHVMAVFIITIKDVEFNSIEFTSFEFIGDQYDPQLKAPEITNDKTNSIPAFVSLPETDLLDQSKSGIPDKIKLFRPFEDDDFFKEVKKIIDEEKYFIEKELKSNVHLPLKETQKNLKPKISDIFYTQEKNNKIEYQYELIYSGPKKVMLKNKFDFLQEQLSKMLHQKVNEMIVIVEFDDDLELVNCHIDQSSGNIQFDEEIVRRLKSISKPMNEASYKGQLSIKKRESND